MKTNTKAHRSPTKTGKRKKSGEEQGRAEDEQSRAEVEQRRKRKSNHDHKESACYPTAQS